VATEKGHKTFRPASYWYACRRHLRSLGPRSAVKREQRLRTQRALGDGKPKGASGRPTRAGPGTKPVAVRNAIGKLLRKREGYAAYFERSLSLVDFKLRRVAIHRTVSACVQTTVQPTYEAGRGASRSAGPGTLVQSGYILPEPRLTRGGVSEIKRMSAGVAGQAKQSLKKYAQCCLSRVGRRQRRYRDRLETWEGRQKRREREERERKFREDLEARQALFNRLGPQGFEGLLRSEESARRRSRPSRSSFYFDEQGNRIRFGSSGSVLG